MDPEGRSPEPLPNEAASRVWSHLLHEDNMLMQRGNFFIVAQSMLIVAYSALVVQMPIASLSGHAVAVFGVLLAIVWLYVGHRHRRYLQHVDRRARHYLSEYAATQGDRPRSPLSTTALLAYMLPSLTVLVWVTLLIMG
ncbi:RipA family octameric membrane protein [Micromonospora profundi]|uniref:RipA family octameric membrane protein n=1 Tax=Micromonospora profundi TaxID=1420889 RepID=UPI003F541F48